MKNKKEKTNQASQKSEKSSVGANAGKKSIVNFSPTLDHSGENTKFVGQTQAAQTLQPNSSSKPETSVVENTIHRILGEGKMKHPPKTQKGKANLALNNTMTKAMGEYRAMQANMSGGKAKPPVANPQPTKTVNKAARDSAQAMEPTMRKGPQLYLPAKGIETGRQKIFIRKDADAINADLHMKPQSYADRVSTERLGPLVSALGKLSDKLKDSAAQQRQDPLAASNARAAARQPSPDKIERWRKMGQEYRAKAPKKTSVPSVGSKDSPPDKPEPKKKAGVVSRVINRVFKQNSIQTEEAILGKHLDKSKHPIIPVVKRLLAKRQADMDEHRVKYRRHIRSERQHEAQLAAQQGEIDLQLQAREHEMKRREMAHKSKEMDHKERTLKQQGEIEKVKLQQAKYTARKTSSNGKK